MLLVLAKTNTKQINKQTPGGHENICIYLFKVT